MLPFLKRLRVWLTGIRSVSFFAFSGLTFACVRGIVRYILSETGVGPVPILPVVSHMFPPAFCVLSLGIEKWLFLRRNWQRFTNSQARPRPSI